MTREHLRESDSLLQRLTVFYVVEWHIMENKTSLILHLCVDLNTRVVFFKILLGFRSVGEKIFFKDNILFQSALKVMVSVKRDASFLRNWTCIFEKSQFITSPLAWFFKLKSLNYWIQDNEQAPPLHWPQHYNVLLPKKDVIWSAVPGLCSEQDDAT